MDFCTRIKQIRLSTGMTRKQFCAYFDIPYRTVTLRPMSSNYWNTT